MPPKKTRKTPDKTSPPQSGSNHLVVPDHLPPEVLRVFKLALTTNPVERGFLWILERMSEEHLPIDLAEKFLARYEDQIMALQSNVLDGYRPAFRAALISRSLEVLPYFQMRFAQKAFNSLFLHTWLQKQLVAALMGITYKDIEVKIHFSGRTAPRYLDLALTELLPKTCIPHLF